MAFPLFAHLSTTMTAPKTKKAQEGVNSRLMLVMKSGKALLGHRQSLKTLRDGSSKLVLVSSNTPALKKAEVEYYAMLSKTSVLHYNGTNVELGTAVGKAYPVGILSITDEGDSDILVA
ncbi:hypothetical protein RCL1_002650 [Eukaryota sp. TZLM3-RCL]